MKIKSYYLLILLSLFVWSCEETKETPIFGCTDSEACNFNPYANTDINNCIYAFEVGTYYENMDCDGNCIEGYSTIIGDSDYWGNQCYFNSDIEVLEDFIENSSSTLNYTDLDRFNINGIVDWYELGYQKWENGRLVTFFANWVYTNEPDFLYISNLSGLIPDSIVNWDYVTSLSLGLGLVDGMLTGSIDSLAKLSNLEFLSIVNNDFDQQDFPEEIYDLTNLKDLYIAKNNFTGSISSNIGNLVNLEDFWAGENNFSGELPIEVWEIPNLRSFGVEYNNLAGSLPDFSQFSLDSLYWLNLNDNNFSGEIPHSLCELDTLMANLDQGELYQDTYYYYFDISNNSFCPNDETSEYPECIANYVGDQNTEDCGGGLFHMPSVRIKTLSKKLSIDNDRNKNNIVRLSSAYIR